LNTSTKTLPEGYAQSGEINLKKNKQLAIILNVAAVLVAIAVFVILAIFAAPVRPGILRLSGSFTTWTLLIQLGLMVLLFTLHELIHGIFFWVFTRSRPVFAVRALYACAGAPDWYIPARQYAVVTIGPLAVIGTVGVLLMLLVPESWVLVIAFLVALNTGGAVGDLLVFNRIFKLPRTSFANDTGDVITFYERRQG
jgi:hypothetical protein